jgi:uncharacterized protein YchJ
MRSHYTAYAMHNAAYLQETWDATKRPEKIDFSRENIDWLRLEITDTNKGGIKDSKGVVAFKAFYSQDGEEHVMNEISRFTKINGCWFYLDGVIKSIGRVGMQMFLCREQRRAKKLIRTNFTRDRPVRPNSGLFIPLWVESPRLQSPETFCLPDAFYRAAFRHSSPVAI